MGGGSSLTRQSVPALGSTPEAKGSVRLVPAPTFSSTGFHSSGFGEQLLCTLAWVGAGEEKKAPGLLTEHLDGPATPEAFYLHHLPWSSQLPCRRVLLALCTDVETEK